LRFIKPSYDQVRADAFELYDRLTKSRWMPDVNVGVGRGGLFVLRCLQDFYVAAGVKIPYLVPSVERYDGINSTGRIKIRHLLKRDVANRRVLIVDDVSDQGDSLISLVETAKKKGASEVRTATIHFKPWSKLRPDYFVRETDAWIIYPWEVYESIRLVLEKTIDQPAHEAFTELRQEAGITKDEYRRFCSIAVTSSSISPSLKLRMTEVCKFYDTL
jgi:hypoxanthine phosphoribosyltransferase